VCAGRYELFPLSSVYCGAREGRIAYDNAATR
jgi:hypothetical protein